MRAEEGFMEFKISIESAKDKYSLSLDSMEFGMIATN
jgi:hypothetical protein